MFRITTDIPISSHHPTETKLVRKVLLHRFNALQIAEFLWENGNIIRNLRSGISESNVRISVDNGAHKPDPSVPDWNAAHTSLEMIYLIVTARNCLQINKRLWQKFGVKVEICDWWCHITQWKKIHRAVYVGGMWEVEGLFIGSQLFHIQILFIIWYALSNVT